MKILIFAGVSPNTFVYMMDEAELYYRLGHEVYFVYCDPQAEICWENMKRNTPTCELGKAAVGRSPAFFASSTSW